MNSLTFEFYVELEDGEMTWLVTADISPDCRYVDITGAYPAGELSADYDASDLEAALADEGTGRAMADVEQAARDAFVAKYQGGSRMIDLPWTGPLETTEPEPPITPADESRFDPDAHLWRSISELTIAEQLCDLAYNPREQQHDFKDWALGMSRNIAARDRATDTEAS